MSHEQQETSDAALSLVKEFFAAKERHDLYATMALFSEDAVYIFSLPASGKQENWFSYKGKEAVTNSHCPEVPHLKGGAEEINLSFEIPSTKSFGSMQRLGHHVLF